MAYSNENLSVLAYSNSFTLWHYKTEDASTAVVAADYFNDATDMLRVGDMILVNSDTSTTAKNGVLAVSSNASDVVGVSAVVALA